VYTYGHVWAAYSGGVSGSTIEETRIFGDDIDPSSHAATYPIFTVAGDIGGVEHYMGHLYVVSITDKAIRKYTYTGSLVTSYPIGTHLSNPKHIARMGRGFLVCEESGNSALFDLDFNYLLSATLSSGPAKLIGLHKHWRYSDGEMITIGYFDDSTVDAFQVAEVTGVGDAIEQVGVAGEPLYKRIR
jgi:hypothetical protein